MQLVLSSLVGVLLIALAARDIFQTLFQPAGRGRVSARFTHAAWTALSRLGRRRPSLLPRVGPLLMIATAAYWVLLLVFGWALLLWPHLPDSFLLASGLEPSEEGGFLDAVYLSLVTLTTLGYGDMTPREEWLRIVAPLEGVVGFAVLTAVISWVLSIYGGLTRRRSLAREAATYLEAPRSLGVALDDLDDATLERVLARLTSGLIAVRQDLVSFPDSFYFHSPDARSSLARLLPSLLALTEEIEKSGSPGVRFHNRAFGIALDDLGALLSERFLGGGRRPTRDAFAAYAAEHDRSGASDLELPPFE